MPDLVGMLLVFPRLIFTSYNIVIMQDCNLNYWGRRLISEKSQASVFLCEELYSIKHCI